MGGRITIRDARPADFDIVAGIFTRARHTLLFLPRIHSEEEDRVFVRDTLFAACHIRLSVLDKRACGFVAIEDGWIRQLHVDPGHFAKGIGSMLLRDAQSRANRLELWCFEENRRARRLYERFGFRAVEFTNGEHTEEKAPDIHYVWDKPAG